MPNDVTALMDKILARFHMHARQKTLMPALVNSDFDVEAKRKGSTIDVAVPAVLDAYEILPGATRSQGNTVDVKTVQVPLDKWYGNGFALTDKEVGEINTNDKFLPMQAIECLEGLLREINRSIFAEYYGVYGFTGVAGQTPFQKIVTPATQTDDRYDTHVLSASRGVLNRQLAPPERRRFVMDVDADTNATRLEAFRDASKRGDANTNREGEIGRASGFDCFWEHQIPTHTAGTLTGDPTVQGVNAAAPNDRESTVVLATDADDAIALKKGDVVRFSGDTQTYAVLEDLTVGNSATGSLKVSPGLKVATAGGETISVEGDHVVNLGFHWGAFAFAMRVMQDLNLPTAAGAVIRTLQDPKTGMVFRLELKREHKQTYFEIDSLWGTKLVLPHLANRAAG